MKFRCLLFKGCPLLSCECVPSETQCKTEMSSSGTNGVNDDTALNLSLEVFGIVMALIFLVSFWFCAKFTNQLFSPTDMCSMHANNGQPTPIAAEDGTLSYFDSRLNMTVQVGQTMVPARQACGDNTTCIGLIASPCDGSVHPINGNFYLQSLGS